VANITFGCPLRLLEETGGRGPDGPAPGRPALRGGPAGSQTAAVSIRGLAHLAGAFEHPRREIPDRTLAEIHAEVAAGAVADAGLGFGDVDGFFVDGMAPGWSPLSMAESLGLDRLTWFESTESGGSSYLMHVGHAAAAIAAGKCSVALITLAGKPRSDRGRAGGRGPEGPESSFEWLWGVTGPVSQYALVAQRHCYEFGTTSEQLAWIKVAASRHAKHNPHAFLPDEVTVDEVLGSRLISDPLHLLDCCVVTDGGGALVVVSREVARSLSRRTVTLLGHGEAPKHTANGRIDLTYTGAVWSGPRAFAEAGVEPADVDYASIYDSFTITVLETIEDLGFCEKGKGGAFVADGGLESPHGRLPFNTDGGGLCNNHPGNRGGMTKIIEAVRQLRGEAHPAVQVPDCEIALVHGTGGSLATRSGAATLVLGRENASP
jgi:acetyl-CoA C-acetyltransferase